MAARLGALAGLRCVGAEVGAGVGTEVRKFKSGAEAAAAALAAARSGAAPLVSAPGSEVSLLPIKYKSGREAAPAEEPPSLV